MLRLAVFFHYNIAHYMHVIIIYITHSNSDEVLVNTLKNIHIIQNFHKKYSKTLLAAIKIS